MREREKKKPRRKKEKSNQAKKKNKKQARQREARQASRQGGGVCRGRRQRLGGAGRVSRQGAAGNSDHPLFTTLARQQGKWTPPPLATPTSSVHSPL